MATSSSATEFAKILNVKRKKTMVNIKKNKTVEYQAERSFA